MKTSKIKNVVNTKEWSNNGRTIIYHNLEMDNGDKINIGKTKVQNVGWELTYEILEQGQQEFNKAKSVQKDNQFTPNKTQKTDAVQNMIVKQSSLKAAVEFCDKDCSVEDIIDNAEIFYNWVVNDERPDVSEKVPF